MMGAPLDPAIAQARDASRGLGTYAHEGPGYIPDVWEMTRRLLLPGYEAPALELPEAVGIKATTRLTASLYPDCPLCRHDVNGCACDPDEYAEAVWLQFQQAKGKSCD